MKNMLGNIYEDWRKRKVKGVRVMSKKKKRLMFPMKCDKCEKEPVKENKDNWEVIQLNCSCGGRIITDFSKPYYE